MVVQIIDVASDEILESYDSNNVEIHSLLFLQHGDAIITIGGLHGLIVHKEADVFRKILRIFLSLTIHKLDDERKEQPQQRSGE